jgi:hypothetical protein
VDWTQVALLAAAFFREQRLAMSMTSRTAFVLVFLALDCTLAGCATSSVPANWTSPSVAPAKVAIDQYLGMNCEALKDEKAKIAARQSELGPTLIPVVDESKREKELSELSGEIKAVDEATAKNNCRTATQKVKPYVAKAGSLDAVR